MRDISPTGNYRLSLPEDIIEDCEGNVASFWRDGQDLLLQVSSFVREEGEQVPAVDRLATRLQREDLSGVRREIPIELDCSDWAAAQGTDEDGIVWTYIYAVWPDLTVFFAVSGKMHEVYDSTNWAFDAVRSMERAD